MLMGLPKMVLLYQSALSNYNDIKLNSSNNFNSDRQNESDIHLPVIFLQPIHIMCFIIGAMMWLAIQEQKANNK